MPIMTMLDFVIYALATWRLSSLIAREDGPFDMLERLRGILGVRYDERSQPYGTNTISRGLLCVWCNSVWFGAAFALLAAFLPIAVWLALPFALSAAALLIERICPHGAV